MNGKKGIIIGLVLATVFLGLVGCGQKNKTYKISKLKKVSIGTDGEITDCSNWTVLEDEGEYITLISHCSFGKDSSKFFEGEENIKDTFNSYKELFEKYGMQFDSKSDIRVLNESDLKKYFDCNLETLTCSKKFSTGSTVTSIVKNDKDVFVDENGLINEDAIVPVRLVIKIKKDK